MQMSHEYLNIDIFKTLSLMDDFSYGWKIGQMIDFTMCMIHAPISYFDFSVVITCQAPKRKSSLQTKVNKESTKISRPY